MDYKTGQLVGITNPGRFRYYKTGQKYYKSNRGRDYKTRQKDYKSGRDYKSVQNKVQVKRAFKGYFFVTKKNNKKADRLCMKFSSTFNTSM